MSDGKENKIKDFEDTLTKYTRIMDSLIEARDFKISELEAKLVEANHTIERIEALHSVPLPKLSEYPGVL